MELLPRDQIALQRMLDTIRRNFERFGFLPVETPVMELSEVLLTKSGGETERQVYFVQSTGALENGIELIAKAAQTADSANPLSADVVRKAAHELAAPELALRFDLTVPLARYVAEHEHDLTFPFRRYQMQRVYRGERAQRGRFREFYQCDIDVIGKDALSVRHDAELPAVIHALFAELAIGPFTIQLNNRKLLRGFFQEQGIGDGDLQARVLREVDKLDKRGVDHVRDTLIGEGFELAMPVVAAILDFVSVRSTSHDDALAKLDALDASRAEGNDALREGVAELREVLTLVRALGVPESAYALNFSIARGLDYYTGTVYETTLDDYPQIGSICSGGRYEDLASHYTKSKLPGVGISIGLTRLFWQLREAGLVDTAASTVQVLVTQMDAASLPHCLAVANELRHGGLNTEVVMESSKIGKQFKYADRAGIRFVVVLGENEIEKGTVTVKDLRREDQFEVARADLARTLRVELAQAQAQPQPQGKL